MKQPITTCGSNTSPAALLYQRHAGPILVYLRLQTRSGEDAEDLLVEVFLAAFEEVGLLTLPEAKQRAWLRTVAHHKVVDHYRRSVRRLAVPLEQVEEILQEDEERSPESLALRQEERRRLGIAITRLPELQQEVLRLRFRDGLRAAQIATLVGKREGAIQKLLSRTMTHLRALYEDQQEGAPTHDVR